MFKHIVFWKVKEPIDGNTKEGVAEQIKKQLETLPEKLSQIQFLEVGINQLESPASWDIVLTTAFLSKDDFLLYRDHPDHLKVVEFVKARVEDRAVVDFNT